MKREKKIKLIKEKDFYGAGEIDFFTVLEMIIKNPTVEFCDSEDERTLKRPHVCIYKYDEFVGKIRFVDTDGNFCPQIETSVLKAIGWKL